MEKPESNGVVFSCVLIPVITKKERAASAQSTPEILQLQIFWWPEPTSVSLSLSLSGGNGMA